LAVVSFINILQVAFFVKTVLQSFFNLTVVYGYEIKTICENVKTNNYVLFVSAPTTIAIKQKLSGFSYANNVFAFVLL